MFGVESWIVKSLKESYTPGTRVMLDYMNDPYTRIEVGTKGTVRSVDDMGTIHVNWDDGHGLGIVYGEDRCHKIEEE